MSYSFYVRDLPILSFEEVFVDYPEHLRCKETDLTELSGIWPEGAYYHVYLEGVSTREIELFYEQKSFSARVMSGSCREDYLLAIELCEHLASQHQTQLISEEGEAGRPSPDWINNQVESLAQHLLVMAKRPDIEGALHLSGPEREFLLGPKTLLLIEHMTGSPGERLTDMMRRVQWAAQQEGYYAANTMALKKDSGEQMTFAVWAPGVRYLFPEVEQLSLDTDPVLFFPYARITELGVKLKWLDDGHCLVEAVTASEWPALLERAQTLLKNQLATEIATEKKPWWQFWR